MAETLEQPPFPPLAWDGWYWRAPLVLPWFPAAETPELIVHPKPSRSAGAEDEVPASPPTPAQAAALRFLLEPEIPLAPSLLAQFRTYLPELADADWAAVREFLEPAAVHLFHPSHEDVAYTGLVFNCLDWECGYEHGIGIVTHKERVVHFGMAEEAGEEAQALKDLRRLARAGKTGKHS